ncbi:hypothetical protein CFP71_29880 [Amycolatopsis thailandensis]|uniref:DUF2637 domain-containing protein n=1 Tax=Amycolatopsis thailandensis TaxID=589330 RepID=A0A229RSA7_9PSEU|nr:DUF2637 domain-containing protein [Amycolatopsis thailandensis]OXM49557.1 hypothetical protein CFP71_29880 [Amycolatopsis thailandensis]
MSMDEGTTRREEARADRAASAEQRRADKAAERAEEREDRRLEFEQRRAAEVAKQEARDAKRASRKAAWSRSGKALVAASRRHALDLLFVPVILVPAILAWSAMAEYGKQIFGPVGVLLPLFSEAAMWAFAAAVTIGVRRGEPTGWLKAGVWVFAAVAAGLNFLHGFSTGHHWDTGVVMAVVSIGGVVVHQLITARPSAARAKSATADRPSEATVQPEPVQPEAPSAVSVQSPPVQPGLVDASSTHAAGERPVARPESVQPYPAGERDARVPSADRPVVTPSSPKRDRALHEARKYQALHGSLPTVDQLSETAEVSRGTAGTVLKELREQPHHLHVITNNSTTKANS